MKARLGNPDGPIFDANEVREDSPEKAGPWFCSTRECPVQFKYHRVASYAIDEPGRVVRNATFGHGADRAHLPTCYLNERAINQKLLADHRAVLSVEGDKLLLNWGDAPVLKRPSGTPEPRDHVAMTRERYAAVMKAANDIAKVVDDSDYDDEVLKRYWVVYKGTKIEWNRFCYGPDGDNLFRIMNIIGKVFNPEIAPWPLLVRAIVSDPADTTDARVRLNLRAPTRRSNGQYVRLVVFAKPRTPGAAKLVNLNSSEQVFVLDDGTGWKFLSDTGRPCIWITKPEQISASRSV